MISQEQVNRVLAHQRAVYRYECEYLFQGSFVYRGSVRKTVVIRVITNSSELPDYLVAWGPDLDWQCSGGPEGRRLCHALREADRRYPRRTP